MVHPPFGADGVEHDAVARLENTVGFAFDVDRNLLHPVSGPPGSAGIR